MTKARIKSTKKNYIENIKIGQFRSLIKTVIIYK